MVVASHHTKANIITLKFNGKEKYPYLDTGGEMEQIIIHKQAILHNRAMEGVEVCGGYHR